MAWKKGPTSDEEINSNCLDYLGCYAINICVESKKPFQNGFMCRVAKHYETTSCWSQLDHVNRPQKSDTEYSSFSSRLHRTKLCLLSLFFITKKQFLLCKTTNIISWFICSGDWGTRRTTNAKHAAWSWVGECRSFIWKTKIIAILRRLVI